MADPRSSREVDPSALRCPIVAAHDGDRARWALGATLTPCAADLATTACVRYRHPMCAGARQPLTWDFEQLSRHAGSVPDKRRLRLDRHHNGSDLLDREPAAAANLLR